MKKSTVVVMRILSIILMVLGLLLLIADTTVGIIILVIGAALLVYSIILGKKVKSAKIAAETPQEKAPDVLIPSKIGDAPIVYRYNNVPIIANAETGKAVTQMAAENRWELTAQHDGTAVNVYYGSTCIGVLNERSDMMVDWLRRGDPYKMIMQNYNTDTQSCVVMLVFYRDKFKNQQNREQSVFVITGHKGKAKQEAISFLGVGDELDLEEDFDHAGAVIVSYQGDEIGKLPAKAAARYISDGCYGARVEQIDDDINENGDIVYTPSIRIYWN